MRTMRQQAGTSASSLYEARLSEKLFVPLSKLSKGEVLNSVSRVLLKVVPQAFRWGCPEETFQIQQGQMLSWSLRSSLMHIHGQRCVLTASGVCTGWVKRRGWTSVNQVEENSAPLLLKEAAKRFGASQETWHTRSTRSSPFSKFTSGFQDFSVVQLHLVLKPLLSSD